MDKINKETNNGENKKKLSENSSVENGEITKKQNRKINSRKKTKKKTNDNHSFKTSEVIVLLLLTCIISLIMGAVLNSRFDQEDRYTQLIDANPELKSFLETYIDVINNYYEEVDKDKIIEDAIEGLFSSLDINSSYLNATEYDSFNKQLDGEYKGIGIEVVNDEAGNILILSVFEDTPAQQAGLKVMDVVKSINGTSLEGKETSELVKLINESKNSNIEMLVDRNGEEIKINIKQDNVVLKSVSSEVIEEQNKKIGYINIGIFANNTAKQFSNELKQLEDNDIDSLIIDVRDNSGGHLTTTVNILSQLLSKEHVIYQVQTKEETTKYYSKGKETKKYPIVVLINEISASASEVLASALKEQLDATLIGEQSFGKGTIQELQQLATGDSYKITTKKWLTSKGEWINDKGLTPDIKVSLNEKYYEEPRKENDNQLQRAIEYLANQATDS